MGDFQFICEEADIGLGRKTKKKFSEEGILSFHDLLKKTLVLDPKNAVENELFKVVDWYKWFQRSHGRAPVMGRGGDFNGDAFDDFKENSSTVEIPVPRNALGEIYGLLRDDQQINDLVKQRGLMSRIQAETVKDIEAAMTPELKRGVGTFDSNSFSRMVVDIVFHNAEPNQQNSLAFVVGQTQVGKSSVKAVTSLASNSVRVPTVIVTRGVSESKELVKKLRGFLDRTPLARHVVGVSSPDRDGTLKKGPRKLEELKNALTKNGAVVLADTAHQMKKVTDALKANKDEDPKFEFLLVVDECDAVLCRTPDRRTKIEQAFDNLVDLIPPILTVMISATPVPLMLEAAYQERYKKMGEPQMFSIEPREEYCGINDMELLQDHNGDTVFLDSKELSWSTFYTCPGDSLLIENAVGDPSKKGVLLLDCTNPRVYAPGNVREKAKHFQEMAKAEHGRKVVVMIKVGRGIEVLAPSSESDDNEEPSWIWQDTKLDVDDVIGEIDDLHGLDTPVFCFGFSKMSRGCSYRSVRRVPTHMIISLGRGHNIMSYVQALGRATFNGKSILSKNGFSAVTVLTTPQDYTTAVKELRFVDEMFRRVWDGETFRQALTGAKTMIPDAANFLRNTPRAVSRLKRHREQLQISKFEKPPKELSLPEKVVRQKHFTDELTQKVLRVICECSNKNASAMCADDVMEAFNDTFLDDEVQILMKKLRPILRSLVDDAVIQRSEKSRRAKTIWYSVDCPHRLLRFMNRKLALTKEEVADGDTLELAIGMGEGDSLSDVSSDDDGIPMDVVEESPPSKRPSVEAISQRGRSHPTTLPVQNVATAAGNNPQQFDQEPAGGSEDPQEEEEEVSPSNN
ncbi:expressed unknown protein [Seminavis robusta]|uniref:Uncharacterized protein n=1 Tax=Seminavis robusta TaxID=568900 RepID=A0A9N8DP94_9STRA|nr:expressed unknown protein [Seminavis robusta]|eukprot:Sro257_g100890.1 n/a (854) ;mRNA; r:50693-53254